VQLNGDRFLRRNNGSEKRNSPKSISASSRSSYGSLPRNISVPGELLCHFSTTEFNGALMSSTFMISISMFNYTFPSLISFTLGTRSGMAYRQTARNSGRASNGNQSDSWFSLLQLRIVAAENNSRIRNRREIIRSMYVEFLRPKECGDIKGRILVEVEVY